MRGRTGGAALLLLAAQACTTTEPQQQAASAPAVDSCQAMTAVADLPDVTVTSATRVPEAAPNTVAFSALGPAKIPVALPAHCLVKGMIDPHTGKDGTPYGLEFALALPADWNGRFLFQGGGGLNGTLNPPLGAQGAGDVPALARGFAVVSTDGGHKGAVFDGKFMDDQRAGLDFYERSVGRVTGVAKQLTAHFYGRPIDHSYIAGCSTGGRETMEGVQRFSDMFDGGLAGAPAMRAGQSRIGAAWAEAAFNRAAPKDAAGKPMLAKLFPPEDRKLLGDALLKSCDASDGVADGIVADPTSCRFDPAVLTCKAGKTADCLSKAQVGAVKTAFAGPKDSHGNQVYPGFFYDTGLFAAGPISFIPTGAPGLFGPPNLSQDLDVDAQLRGLNNDPGERLTDTYFWTKLNHFAGRGGKIVFYHGVSDPWFSAQDTIDYYKRITAENGPEISRLYLVPGMSHCGGGQSLDHFDLLTTMVDWVEKGTAPQSVPATGAAFPGRTRPLCPYPSYPRYKGSGDPEKAENFSCSVAP